MNIFQVLLIVLYSLVLSSFFNVVAIRIPKGESIVSPPSHCVHCHHRLSVLDLIPVLSYLVLRGKCRYCHSKISPYYLVGELVTTTALGVTVVQMGFLQELWVAVPLVCLLATISISDLIYQIIPNKINLVGFTYFFILRCFYHPLPFYDYLLGIAAGGGLLLLIAVLSRGGMGGGDIKLMSVVGLALGWKLTLLALFSSSLLGSLIGISLLSLRVIQRKQPIPFGPFLAVGSLGAYLWGEDLITSYMKHFLL
jgi:leader peptidase (prepilin peptidase)/N-methyltransferase